MKRTVLLLLLPVLLFSGCASRSPYAGFREIEDMQIIQTIGFDGAPGETTVSVSSGQDPDRLPTILTTEGVSITAAGLRLQDWAAREDLFFAHVQYVVVGEAAARYGLEDLLDYFERSSQTRLGLPLFVVRGGTAQQLIAGAPDREYEISRVLSSLERDEAKYGAVHCFTLGDIACRLARSGAALCCAVVREPVDGTVPSAEEGAATALAYGYAVFRDGRLVRFLDEETARGASLLLGRVGEDVVVLSDGGGGAVTLELHGGSAKLSPVWDADGGLTLRVRLEYRAGIREFARSGAGGEDDKALALLEQEFSRWLARSAEKALEAARDTGADFLEVGRTLQRADPRRFAALGWSGFPASLRWEIEAVGKVSRSYELSGSASTNGEGRDHV